MPLTTPALIKIARPPFSKPQPGTPINWAHWLTKGLVASWPMNEGKGDTLAEYASGHEFYTATWVGKMAAPLPTWTTVGKVTAVDNTGYTSGFIGNPYLVTETAAASGFPNLPQIDFTEGITIHTWCSPFDPALSTVTGTIFSIGDRNGNAYTLSLDLGHQFQGYFVTARIGNGPTFSTYNTSANCWPNIEDIPNQLVLSLVADPLVSGSLLLNLWDVNGGHLIDNQRFPGTIQNFDQYNFNGFYIGSPGTSGSGIKAYWYAMNVWNRGLGEYEAKSLMYNPLQFYGANNMGGQVGGAVIPDAPDYDLPAVTLTATPSTIFQGDVSVLEWTSLRADTLTIDQSIGAVVIPDGTTNVLPSVTTTYTITATNAFGSATASATVTVTPRGGGRPAGVSPGAILQRDLTVTTDAAMGGTDNGAPFAAYAVIGSVVLTHPSELAMVLFITTEAIAAGSHPIVSVILDEIAPSIAVPFVSLGAYVADPPVLVAAQTIYNDRFYISQTRQAAVCRHLQMRLDWPAEAAANELLTWSVIGAHVEER